MIVKEHLGLTPLAGLWLRTFELKIARSKWLQSRVRRRSQTGSQAIHFGASAYEVGLA